MTIDLQNYKSIQHKMELYEGFEVLTAVLMKIAIVWDIVRIWTEDSEERITSIFRVENQPSKKLAWGQKAWWVSNWRPCFLWYSGSLLQGQAIKKTPKYSLSDYWRRMVVFSTLPTGGKDCLYSRFPSLRRHPLSGLSTLLPLQVYFVQKIRTFTCSIWRQMPPKLLHQYP
jgi:hypothetical protein